MHGILISLYLAFPPLRQTYIFGHCQHSRFSRICILNSYHHYQPSHITSHHQDNRRWKKTTEPSHILQCRAAPCLITSHHVT